MPTYLIRRMTRSRRAVDLMNEPGVKTIQRQQRRKCRTAFILSTGLYFVKWRNTSRTMRRKRKYENNAKTRVTTSVETRWYLRERKIKRSRMCTYHDEYFSIFLLFVPLRFLSELHFLNFVLARFRTGIFYHRKIMKLTTVFKRVILINAFPGVVAYARHVSCSRKRQIVLCHFTINFSLEN